MNDKPSFGAIDCVIWTGLIFIGVGVFRFNTSLGWVYVGSVFLLVSLIHILAKALSK